MDELEKKIRLARLLDFYGPLLTEHRRELLRMYCEEDLSLAEIAQAMGDMGKPLTRQGVYDAVAKAEKQLAAYEAQLGLMDRYDRLTREADFCLAALEKGEVEAAKDALRRMKEIER
jgi:predicted DNA-binding protein YlxM (UPF0122 family)